MIDSNEYYLEQIKISNAKLYGGSHFRGSCIGWYNVVNGVYFDSLNNSFVPVKVTICDKLNIGLKEYIEENKIDKIPILLTGEVVIKNEEELKANALKYKIKNMSNLSILGYVFFNVIVKNIINILICVFFEVMFLKLLNDFNELLKSAEYTLLDVIKAVLYEFASAGITNAINNYDYVLFLFGMILLATVLLIACLFPIIPLYRRCIKLKNT